MTNIRTVATIAFLLTAGSEAAIAMSPQELPAEVKSCKAITNNKERLKCFDELFGETSRFGNTNRKICVPHAKA